MQSKKISNSNVEQPELIANSFLKFLNILKIENSLTENELPEPLQFDSSSKLFQCGKWGGKMAIFKWLPCYSNEK